MSVKTFSLACSTVVCLKACIRLRVVVRVEHHQCLVCGCTEGVPHPLPTQSSQQSGAECEPIIHLNIVPTGITIHRDQLDITCTGHGYTQTEYTLTDNVRS